MKSVPVSSEVRSPKGSPPAKCGRCGYELTGLKPRSRCPECGARDAGGRIRDADSLARSSYSSIVGVIWRSAGVMIGQVGFLLVAISIIRTFPVWLAVFAAVWVTAGVWFRTSIELDPDRDHGVPFRGLRHLLRIAILLGALGLVIVALVPGVPRGSMIEAGSITVVLAAGVVAAVLGRRTAWWLQHELAQGNLEAAPWAWILTLGGVVLVLGSHFAGLLPPGGISATGPKLALAAFVGAIGWAAVVLFADVLVFASSIRCLLHRAHYEDLERRREERRAEAARDFDDRVRLMDGGGKTGRD